MGEKVKGSFFLWLCDPGYCRELETANGNLLIGVFSEGRFAQHQGKGFVILSIVACVSVTTCN